MTLLRQVSNSLRLGVGLLACAMAVGPVIAQTFPSKPLTVVVPYPPGGASDFVARLIQPEYQKQLGQTMIVDNVGGVGGEP